MSEMNERNNNQTDVYTDRVESPFRGHQEPSHNDSTKSKKRSSLAALLACCVVLSGAAGFGGGYAASYLSAGTQSTVNASSTQTASGDYTTLATGSGEMSVAEVAAKTADSVVEITTESVTNGYTWLQQYVTAGAGSGVILTEDGYIVTNNHVIEDASKITVRLHDGNTYQATLIGTDSKTDVALLKIDATGLTPATLGDSDSLVVGETAVAVGNPLGELGGTVTNGIISALDREISLEGETMTLLQTNAAINPGNSGGGLFNGNGELIGLVVAKSSGTDVEGLGFAIPVNVVKEVVQQLRDNGYVTGRPLLGVSLIDVTTMQDMMRYQVTRGGVYVYQVTGESAAKAGLLAGDCITSINGQEVTTSDEVKAIVEQSNVGDQLKMTIVRGTETMELTVEVGEEKPASFQVGQDSTANL